MFRRFSYFNGFSGATSYTWNPGALSGTTVAVTPTATTTTYTVDGDNGLAQELKLLLVVGPIININRFIKYNLITGSSGTLTASGATGLYLEPRCFNWYYCLLCLLPQLLLILWMVIMELVLGLKLLL